MTTYVKFVRTTKNKVERDKFLEEFYEPLPKVQKEVFDSLRARVDERAREVKKRYNFVFESMIKKTRPLFTYVLIGALVSTGAAFVTHVISKMSNSAK